MATKDGYKPSRQFSGNYGDKTLDNAGPDAIEGDLDRVMKSLNPDAEITDPISGIVYQGGIGSNNIQDKTFTGIELSDMTLNDATTANPSGGDISFIDTLDFLSKMIRLITGKANYYINPVETIESLKNRLDNTIDTRYTKTEIDNIENGLQGQIGGNDNDIIELQGQINSNDSEILGIQTDKANKATTYTKTEVDSLDNNLQGQIDTNDDDVISLQGQINANDNEIADNDIDILALQNNKADKATTYTKTEVDSLDNNLQGQIDTNDTDIIGLQGQIDDNDIDIITKADKANVLELDNTLAFIPDTDYEPSTKRYVDTTVNDATMAVLPEGSITDNYLSDAVGQIKNRVETGIIDEDNTKNYATQLKVVSGKPVLEYEEVL